MKTISRNPKDFALDAIKPYYKDNSLCGIFDNKCMYITFDNKMCVAGQYMLHPENFTSSIGTILKNNLQSKIFIPEVVDILSVNEWILLQCIHDGIANDNNNNYYLKGRVKSLGLFTFEELIA